MPPKKKQASSSLNRSQDEEIGANRNDLKTKANTSKRKPGKNKHIDKRDFDIYEDIDDNYSSGAFKNGHSLLSRQNSLVGMLSSKSSKLSDSQKKSSKSKTHSITKSNQKDKYQNDSILFEEDEGFIYKRSQDPIDKQKENELSRKHIATPISRLRQETENLSFNEDDSIHFDDFDDNATNVQDGTKQLQSKATQNQRSSSKSKPKPKPKTQATLRRKPRSKLEQTKEDEKEQHSKQQSPPPTRRPINRRRNNQLQLSSPIRSPNEHNSKFNQKSNFNDEYDSDQYTEEVSHHKIELADAQPKSRKRPLTTSVSDDLHHNTKRRTSYHNRGKRVLSIGNGFIGEPHDNVEPSDFYKFLNSSMPDPIRMRQLLIWCSKKTLQRQEKEHDLLNNDNQAETVKGITKVITDEILDDLTNSKISTSWYNRLDDEDTYNRSIRPILPNPLNESNEENITLYEGKLKQLKKEKVQWEIAYKKSTQSIDGFKISKIDDNKILSEYLENKSEKKRLENGYDEENQSDYYSTTIDESRIKQIEGTWRDLKENIPNKLESSIDKFYNTSFQIQKANELVGTIRANNINDKVSSLVKKFVLKNDPQSFANENDINQNSPWPVPKQPITTRELLKGISRLDNSKQNNNGSL